MAADIELRKLTRAIEALARATEKQNRLLEVINENVAVMYAATILNKEKADAGSS